MVSTPAFAPWTDPDAAPLIDIRGVTKRFGDFTAIRDLSLRIYEREFFAILGPSGCGKTTLMRMLGGFDEPTEGTITLGGQVLSGIPPAKRPVNMMFQSYALFPHLSVERNIAFGLKREGMPKDRIAERVDQMLGLVQMRDFASRKPHQLSGGQRQRVALARSLAKRPKLLLLDEPLGALDKKLREETQFELMEIQETLGCTFVIVTHDQEEAMTVSSRIAVMRQGEIAQVATPVELYEYPASRYVADFIGDVNLIEGRVGDDGRLHWSEGGAALAVPEGAAAGTEGALAVRPEKIAVTKVRPEAGGNVVSGEVIDIAYLGHVSTYHVKLPNGQVVKAQETNRVKGADRGIDWEDEVWLAWDAEAGVFLTE